MGIVKNYKREHSGFLFGISLSPYSPTILNFFNNAEWIDRVFSLAKNKLPLQDEETV